jgi:hypothetical protein
MLSPVGVHRALATSGISTNLMKPLQVLTISGFAV